MRKTNIEIKVEPRENIERAIKRFSRKVMDSEVLREYRDRTYFVSKSEKTRKRAEKAKRRAKYEL